jgi:hypothetical protein
VASGSEAILRIKVVADATAAAAGLDKSAKSTSKFAGAMRKAALPAAAVVAGIGALGAAAVKSASDLQQAEGAVEAVFGKQAGAVKQASQSAATTMGLSASQYQNYAALVGTALQNAGLSVKDSVTESGKVMQRGADLSALYGGTTADAVDAINAAVSRSEFDPLEKYGVSLNMTAVNAELAAKGQDKLTGKQLDAAKKAIILEQVYKKSAKAAGQYAREADSVAGRSQTMAAQMENAKASLGTALLPVVAKGAALLGKFATFAEKNTTTVQILAGVVGGLAVAVLAINAAMTISNAVVAVNTALTKLNESALISTRIQVYALAAAQKIAAVASKAWAIATRLLNAAFVGSPIGLIIVLIIAVAAALYLAYKRSATFRKIVDAAFRAVASAAKIVGKIIAAAFSVAFKLASAYVRAYVTVIRAVFSILRAVVSAVATFVRDKFGDAWRVVSQVARTQMQIIRSAIDAIRRVVSEVADALKAGWSAAWRGAQSVASAAMNAIKGPLDSVKAAIDRVVSAVQGLIGWIGRIKFPSPPSFLSKIPGNPLSLSAPSPAASGRGYVAAPALGRGMRARATTSSAGSGITIVINGALDPEAVARRIGAILSGHERRVGRRVA